MGRLRRQSDDTSSDIKWVRRGDWIRTLGVPIGEDFEEEDFWLQRYLKGKKLLATWGIRVARNLTVFGKAEIAGALVFSRYRFYAQVMHIPKSIMQAIISDVQHLVWTSDLDFLPDEIGSNLEQRRTFRAGVQWRKKQDFGIGLLDWESHVKALQVKALLRYNDASTGDWKIVLDQWMFRSRHPWSFLRSLSRRSLSVT